VAEAQPHVPLFGSHTGPRGLPLQSLPVLQPTHSPLVASQTGCRALPGKALDVQSVFVAHAAAHEPLPPTWVDVQARPPGQSVLVAQHTDEGLAGPGPPGMWTPEDELWHTLPPALLLQLAFVVQLHVPVVVSQTVPLPLAVQSAFDEQPHDAVVLLHTAPCALVAQSPLVKHPTHIPVAVLQTDAPLWTQSVFFLHAVMHWLEPPATTVGHTEPVGQSAVMAQPQFPVLGDGEPGGPANASHTMPLAAPLQSALVARPQLPLAQTAPLALLEQSLADRHETQVLLVVSQRGE